MSDIFSRKKSQFEPKTNSNNEQVQDREILKGQNLIFNTFSDLKTIATFEDKNSQSQLQQNRVLTTAEAQRWKEFNSFEEKNHRNLTKEALKREINDITYRISSAREKKSQNSNKTYSAFNMTQQSGWKAPNIEQVDRSFNEYARFYNTHNDQRIHGLKYVPPPKAENLNQLYQEQIQAELMNNFKIFSQVVQSGYSGKKNFQSRSQSQNPQVAKENKYNIASLQNKDQKFFSKKEKKKFDSIFENQQEIQNPKFNINLLKNKLQKQIDSTSSVGIINEDRPKSVIIDANRKKKIQNSVDQRRFIFPKRKRFNENLQQEIEQQRQEITSNSQLALNQKNLEKNMESDNNSKFSLKSSKNLTVSDLSRFFRQNKINESDQQKESTVKYSNFNPRTFQMNKFINPNQKFIKKNINLNNNRRYAASQAGSLIGGLLRGFRTKYDNFAVASQVENTYQENQNHLNIQNEEEYEQKQNLMNEQDQKAEEDDQKESQVIFIDDNESTFFNMLNNATTPKKQPVESESPETASTNPISFASEAPTAIISQKAQEYQEKLKKEQQFRINLENKIKKLKQQMLFNTKLIGMQLKMDKEKNFRVLDQRNLIQN